MSWILLLVAITASIGAMIAKFAAAKSASYLWLFLPGIISTISWICMIRGSDKQIILNSILWTVTYEIAYCGTLIVMGESLTVTRAVGAMVAIIGIMILNS